MGVEFTVSQDLADLLAGGLPDEIEGSVTSNLQYMPALDGITKDGQARKPHSEQAPDGITGPARAAIETNFVHAVSDATAAIAKGANALCEMNQAVADATLFGLRELVEGTPVDTGRAKGSWEARLPNGEVKNAVGEGFAEAHKPPDASFWKTPEGRREAARRRKARRGGAT